MFEVWFVDCWLPHPLDEPRGWGRFVTQAKDAAHALQLLPVFAPAFEALYGLGETVILHPDGTRLDADSLAKAIVELGRCGPLSAAHLCGVQAVWANDLRNREFVPT